jgi:endonuclease/exonuclease/phosphatase family metal-dependent hydrolase
MSTRYTPIRMALSLVGVALAAALVAGCGGSGTSATPEPAGSPMSLKVMEFNIEYGGTQIDFGKVVEAVKTADPDVIGLEEAETNTPRLAKAAGYPYWSNSMQVVSRYPLLEPPDGNGSYLYVEVRPGLCVALSNVHLPSNADGPTLIRRGKTATQVIANEQKVRLPAIQTQLRVLPPLAAKGIPVFLLGDFNEPSHLDYTAAAVGTRDNVKYVVEWPVSKAVADAGFSDSWRAIYPDPVRDPGLTWWAARPRVDGWNPGPKDPQDRIDFIYSAGPAKTTSSALAGEKGGPQVTWAVKPWPSDHRAVVSTFAVTPGPLPVIVAASPKLVTVGQRLTVSYRTAPEGAAKVALVLGGVTSAEAPVSGGAVSGSTSLATAGLLTGDYEVRLLGADGTVQARTPVWLQAKGAKPILTTDKATYAPGEPIVATWKNAPANRWDWLGVYEAGAADPNVDYYLVWQYTGGASSGTISGPVTGSLTLDKGVVEGKPWPLPPGKYVLYYLLADAYKTAAKTTFTVAK